MPWEKRRRGGRYFTRSVRFGGRVYRFYFGAGPLAEALAALHERATARRKARAELRAQISELESQIDELDGLCDDLVHASLERAGFHQHRGEWRRRRG